ncbi:hypothetical protein N7G274_009335 [Stereocaulon virgatum]|uniref:BZIP domain-containing protein n=1 Tax=Stereocaulon virgatum TaxID=373712 RepID=A0ABR3ZYN1_9LECA
MDYASYYGQPAQPYPFFSLPGKPEHPYTPQDEPQHDPLDAFNDLNAFAYPFDQTSHFNANPIIPPPASPPQSISRPSISHALPYDSSSSLPNDGSIDQEYDQAPGRGSSDEDKDNLTPAQTRRKAQNRAAQRAFRERKERHVKDLEIKLKHMDAQSTDLMSENERLKRELDRVATQNEILRATTTPLRLQHEQQPQPMDTDQASRSPESLVPGPMIYSPSTFNAALDHNASINPNAPISHRIAFSATTGERLLSTGAAWDLIQSHELYRRGLVDLAEVADRLKEKATCDGNGPTFAEPDVMNAIEDSVGAAGDELI